MVRTALSVRFGPYELAHQTEHLLVLKGLTLEIRVVYLNEQLVQVALLEGPPTRTYLVFVVLFALRLNRILLRQFSNRLSIVKRIHTIST